MNTSPPRSFLSEVLSSEPIPLGKLAYFRGRLRNRLYEFILTEFMKRQDKEKLAKADLARRIGRRPEQVSRWLGAPGNWTLDTVSDLMLAMGTEPEFSASSLVERRPRNFAAPEWLAAEFDWVAQQQKRAEQREPEPRQPGARSPLQPESGQERRRDLADQLRPAR